jgi:hypothetical protein
MLRVFKNWFHRPAIRMGRVDNSRIRTTPIRNAQFVSFISESGTLRSTSRYTDRYEMRLRRRKVLKSLFILGLTAGAAWIVIESAKALSIF